MLRKILYRGVLKSLIASRALGKSTAEILYIVDGISFQTEELQAKYLYSAAVSNVLQISFC